jgi:hypothetical protein
MAEPTIIPAMRNLASAADLHKSVSAQKVSIARADLNAHDDASVGDMQGYLNLNAYREFAGQNRLEGWTIWMTFAIPLASSKPLATKPTYKSELISL